MGEYQLQLISFSKIIWVACFSYLYGIGGIKNKFWRRFIGAAWIALGVFVFQHFQHNVNWWAMLWPAILCGALILGYGGDDTKTKIIKRLYVGLALSAAVIPLAIISQLWLLAGYSAVLTTSASVVFGVWNPFKNARDEESNVATAAVWLPMFMV